jgi:hypothetical protein
MSGRVGKDLAAAFLRARFLVPLIGVILVLALIIWLARGG